MKVPLSWLRQFVDVAMELDEFTEFLSRGGLEVEDVRFPGAGTSGVTTARVLSRARHPDAEKLQIVRITRGDDEVELVCGAHNFEVGDTVLHAPVGGSIPDLELTARKIRGVVSNGMLCSARELQLGDDHAGIMVLSPDTPLGVDVHDLLPVGEPVIEFSVQPDRGDHLSILGVARDVAALLGTQVRYPADLPTVTPGDAVPIRIEAGDGCSQFVAWTLGDVDVPAVSPWWVRQRLAQCGVRTISPLVDVTNLVMLELGQPMHAYDLDRLGGPALVVRWATPGERLVTLDDVERHLHADDLVVADANGPIGLAGVMGGADSEVRADTTRVVFEAATWDPATIRRTSRRLRLTSEASIRFERGVDPAIAQTACARAVELVRSMGTADDLGVTSDGDATIDLPIVDLDAAWVRRFLGVEELTDDRQVELLERACCDVQRGDRTMQVRAPSWRRDLTRPADLAEEVARLHGYDRIPSTLPLTGVTGGLTASQQAERAVRDAVRAFGLHEAITRPFVGQDHLDGVHPGGAAVVLANPLAQDASAMRTSLVEGLLQAVRRNVGQGRPGVALFEMGRLYRRTGGPLDTVLDAFGHQWRWIDPDGVVLPTQPRALAIAVQGNLDGTGWVAQDDTWSIYAALGVFDEVVARLAPPAGWHLERRPIEREGYHPGRAATLHIDGHEIGFVGQLHPAEAQRRDLPDPVIVGELLLEPLFLDVADGRESATAPRLVRHPAITVDVAVVAELAVAWADVERAIREAAGDLLDDLKWFDEYRGSQIEEGHRSLAARLRLQAPDRQLTGDDEEAVLAAVAAAVEGIGARVRS